MSQGRAADLTLGGVLVFASRVSRERLRCPGPGLQAVFGRRDGRPAACRLSCTVEGSLAGLSLVAPCVDPLFTDFDIKTLDFRLAFGRGIEIPPSGSSRPGLDALDTLGLASEDDDEDRSG